MGTRAVTDRERELVANAQRILRKAQSLPRSSAADYLTPLVHLRSQGREAALASAAVAALVDGLRTDAKATDLWDQAWRAFDTWMSSLNR